METMSGYPKDFSPVCPFARTLRDAAEELDMLSPEDIKGLLLEAADVCQRSHDLLLFFKEATSGGMPKGTA